MNQLSERIQNMATSATLAMAAKARELRAEGKDIIGLSLGEPDFNTDSPMAGQATAWVMTEAFERTLDDLKFLMMFLGNNNAFTDKTHIGQNCSIKLIEPEKMTIEDGWINCPVKLPQRYVSSRVDYFIGRNNQYIHDTLTLINPLKLDNVISSSLLSQTKSCFHLCQLNKSIFPMVCNSMIIQEGFLLIALHKHVEEYMYST